MKRQWRHQYSTNNFTSNFTSTTRTVTHTYGCSIWQKIITGCNFWIIIYPDSLNCHAVSLSKMYILHIQNDQNGVRLNLYLLTLSIIRSHIHGKKYRNNKTVVFKVWTRKDKKWHNTEEECHNENATSHSHSRIKCTVHKLLKMSELTTRNYVWMHCYSDTETASVTGLTMKCMEYKVANDYN